MNKVGMPEKKITDRVFECMVAPLPSPFETMDELQSAEFESLALSVYGQHHWELVAVQGNKAYFKREYCMVPVK